MDYKSNQYATRRLIELFSREMFFSKAFLFHHLVQLIAKVIPLTSSLTPGQVAFVAVNLILQIEAREKSERENLFNTNFASRVCRVASEQIAPRS